LVAAPLLAAPQVMRRMSMMDFDTEKEKMAQTTIYPHEIGRDLIPELATRVYSSQLDSFREAISNAFDESSKQAAIDIRKDKIVIEDWGAGIRDYDEFRKFGQASKKSRSGEVIGEKGLGKLSLLNLGNSVCFETNNQQIGMRFYMSLAGFSKPVYGKRSNSFVDHVGTRITTTQLTCRVDVKEVVIYLKKAFGLRLAQGAKITVNGELIKPKSTLDPKESLLFMLQKSNSAAVTGNLKADKEGKGIVDVYIDHVFVTSVEIDTRRNFSGWVNCNALTPETSRNNIVQNEPYEELLSGLRRYVTRFPLREIAIDKHKLLLSKELNILLKSYIKDMKVSVKSYKNMNLNHGSSSSRAKTPPVTGKNDVKTMKLPSSFRSSNSQDSQEKRSATEARNNGGTNIRWEYADLGNEKGPIYFVPPNTVYCNTSNDLFKFAMMKSRYYGPNWVRMLPYLARIAVEINGESSRLSFNQFYIKVDEATRYFLRQKRVLG
jgi:hypothetical protein